MSWYRCSIPKEWILSVHFCAELPQQDWDEQWFSEELQRNCGRYGEELWIAGETIPVVGGMFEDFCCLREITGQERLNPKNCKDLSRLFAGCISLKQLDVSHWNTAAATTMERMFDGCYRLEALDVSKWKLGKCRSIAAMFRECVRIKELNVSNWSLGQVRDFSDAFSSCVGLTELDVSRWNTASARSMEGLFVRCTELRELDPSKWKTDNVRNFRQMFRYCEKLKKLSLSKWKFRPDAAVDKMFHRMYGSISLPKQRRFLTMKPGESWIKNILRSDHIEKIATIKFRKESGMPAWVDDCWAGDVADSGYIQCIRKGDTIIIMTRGGKVFANENSFKMFCFEDDHDFSWIRFIDGLDLLDTRYTKNFAMMFAYNLTLQHLDIGHFDMSRAQSTMCMFEECRRLHKVDDSKWNIPPTCRTDCMYRGCISFDNGGLRIIK